MLNVLHAHMWGSPWTNDLGIFVISPKMALEMLSSIDCNSKFQNLTFPSALNEFIETFIQNNGPCFFRLSGASPKDSTFANTPLLKATSAEYIRKVCIESNRFEEELETCVLTDRSIAFILRKWDEKIEKCDTYRIFVGEGEYELAVRMSDCTIAKGSTAFNLRKYVDKHIKTFPHYTLALDVALDGDNIIFIEFNPIDDELDMYNVDLNFLSPAIRTLQAWPSVTQNLLDATQEYSIR